jgi:hypothetical protein
MYCEPEQYTYFSLNMLDTVLKYNDTTTTWYGCNNGYIACTKVIDGVRKNIYLHSIIVEKLGLTRDSEKELSIDHINRVKIDNRNENLRLATQSE